MTLTKSLVATVMLGGALILSAGCGNQAPGDTLAEQPVEELTIEERRDRFSERQDEEVGYSNPNTGYTANYELDVEYDSNGDVERINFPNGGWEDDFDSQTDNGDGTLTVTDEDGREFTVPKMDDPAKDVIEDDDSDTDSDGDIDL